MNLEETKLIAEFIGRQGFVNSNLYTFKGLYELTNDTWYKLEDAKFHKDWNWLMAVVEKIENLMTNWDIPNYKNGYSEWMNKFRFAFWDIKCLYEYVVEFIKRYNQMKQSNV